MHWPESIATGIAGWRPGQAWSGEPMTTTGGAMDGRGTDVRPMAALGGPIGEHVVDGRGMTG